MDFFYLFDSCHQLIRISESSLFVSRFVGLLSIILSRNVLGVYQ